MFRTSFIADHRKWLWYSVRNLKSPNERRREPQSRGEWREWLEGVRVVLPRVWLCGLLLADQLGHNYSSFWKKKLDFRTISYPLSMRLMY